MLIYYENSVLNKIVVSVADTFNSLPENNVQPFEHFEDLDFVDLIENSGDELEITIICSSNIHANVISKIMNDSLPGGGPINFVFVIKDAEEENQDSYIITNWYIHWTNAINNLTKEYSLVELEVIDCIFKYYQQFPTLSQRRIVEYLNSHLLQTRRRFIEILTNETLSILQTRGRNVIEQKQKEINKDKKNALIKTFKKRRYALCVSNYIESAFQLIETANLNAVIVFELDLKKSFVNVTVVSKTKDEHIFSSRPHLQSGFCSNLRITFAEFIDVIEKY